MKKTIMLEGREQTIESNALLPRKYRKIFGRDLIVDMRRMVDAYKNDPDSADTEVLENITWLMLKAGGNDVPDSVEEWLATLEDAFAAYSVVGDVVDLWAGSMKTTSVPKKKSRERHAK